MYVRYLSKKQVCEIYPITIPTLNKLISNGTFKSYRLGGKILFKEPEVMEALKEIPAKPQLQVHGQ